MYLFYLSFCLIRVQYTSNGISDSWKLCPMDKIHGNRQFYYTFYYLRTHFSSGLLRWHCFHILLLCKVISNSQSHPSLLIMLYFLGWKHHITMYICSWHLHAVLSFLLLLERNYKIVSLASMFLLIAIFLIIEDKVVAINSLISMVIRLVGNALVLSRKIDTF